MIQAYDCYYIATGHIIQLIADLASSNIRCTVVRGLHEVMLLHNITCHVRYASHDTLVDDYPTEAGLTKFHVMITIIDIIMITIIDVIMITIIDIIMITIIDIIMITIIDVTMIH